MQAIILAAGKGSRLHPITVERSKAMLPILGKPIVERVMESMAQNGIDDFILVVNPDDRHITRHFRAAADFPGDVRFVYQPERRGMADALKQAAPLINSDFVLSACDNLVTVEDMQRLLALWREARPDGILSLMPVSPDQRSSTGIVQMVDDRVVRIIEKPRPDEAPESNIASLPLYCFRVEVLDFLDDVQPSPRGEYELQSAIQMLIDGKPLRRSRSGAPLSGKVLGLPVTGRLTLTRAADLLAINRYYLTNGGDQPQLQPRVVGSGSHLISPLHIEADVVIGAGCVIGPEVYIERGCQIGDRAIVKEAVLLREAVVPPGANICGEVVT